MIPTLGAMRLFPASAKSIRQALKRVLLWLALAFGGFVLLLGCAERSILYPSQYRPAPAVLPLPDHARQLSIDHDQGQTHAHLYLGRGIDADHPGPAVLYSHGNGEFIEDYHPVGLRGYRDMGVSVLLVEYRGTGHSDGKPTKTRIDADQDAFFDLLLQQPEVDPTRVVLHGRSMGGGIVASLAQRREPAALVLESTYSSIRDFAKRLWVPGFIVKDNWDVTATLRTYAGPVFMAHSERDEVIPYAMAEKNHAARPSDLPAITFLPLNVGHNDPMPSTFFDAVETFFRDHGILRPVNQVTPEGSPAPPPNGAYDPPAAVGP